MMVLHEAMQIAYLRKQHAFISWGFKTTNLSVYTSVNNLHTFHVVTLQCHQCRMLNEMEFHYLTETVLIKTTVYWL